MGIRLQSLLLLVVIVMIWIMVLGVDDNQRGLTKVTAFNFFKGFKGNIGWMTLCHMVSFDSFQFLITLTYSCLMTLTDWQETTHRLK